MEERIYIRLSKDLKEEFNKACQDSSINKSDLLRKYIAAWVKKYNEKESVK